MKKVWLLVSIVLILTGCGDTENVPSKDDLKWTKWESTPEIYGGLEVLDRIRHAHDNKTPSLVLGQWKITELIPLAGLLHLTELDLGTNLIENIKPLATLTKLEKLYLDSNQIATISILADFSHLRVLDLHGNKISDPSPLEKLSELTFLNLNNNQISDAGVAALASALRGGALPSCTFIHLRGNPGSGAPVVEALASPERAAALARRQAE